MIAADRDSRELWALHAGYWREGVVPLVPAPVLAQAWRDGARQARLARLLRMCDVEPMSEDLARSVGILAGKAGHDDIVDVAVAEGAIRRGDAVVTSDAAHIAKIATHAGSTLWIESV